MMRKKCLKSIFFLKLLLCSNLTYETKIVTKYNKNADKMAAKMAVYHKKLIRISSLRLTSPGICMQNAYFTDF